MGALLATGARLAAALRMPSDQLEAWPPYLILTTYTTDHLPLTDYFLLTAPKTWPPYEHYSHYLPLTTHHPLTTD